MSSLVCLSPYYKSHKAKRYGLYECFCGSIFTCIASRIKNKKQKSCGCLKSKHRKSKTSEYRIWIDIRRRCLDPRINGYVNYGAKGITICDEWSQSFENFYEDMGPRPDKKHSIDRIDNNKGYSKENCRWATSKEQNRNRGKYNKKLTYKGIEKTQAEWGEVTGIKESTINKRLSKYKWSIEKTLTTPVRNKK